MEVPIGLPEESANNSHGQLFHGVAQPSDAITLITEEEIKNSGELSQLLARQSSMQVRQTSTWGGIQKLSLRGSDAKRILFLIDGVVWERGPGQENFWDIVPLNMIAKIEINRSQSTSWSNLGYESVIQIFTKKFVSKYTQFQVEAGNFGYQKVGANGTYRGDISKNKNSFSWFIQTQKAENNFNFINDQGTSLDSSDDVVEKRKNNSFFEHKAEGQWNFAINPSLTLDGSLIGVKGRQNIPGVRNRQGQFVTLDRESYRFQSSLKKNISPQISHGLQFLHQSNQDDYHDYGATFYQTIENNRYDYEVNHLMWEGVDRWRQSTVTSGGVKFAEEKQKDQYQFQNTNEKFSRTHIVIGQTTSTILPLNVGVYLKSSIDFLKDREEGAARPMQDQVSDLSLGINRGFFQLFKWKAQYSKVEQAPTFYELFGRRALLQGNPNLEVQKSLKWETGLETSYWQKNNLSLALEITLFHQSWQKKIEYSFNSLGVGTPTNLPESWLQGLEISHELNWNPLNSHFTYTVYQSESDSSVRGENKKQLPNLYHRQLTHELVVKISDHLKIGHEWLFRNELYFDTANLLPARPQSLHAFFMNFDSLQNWNVVARLDNAFEERAQEFNGYPAPGKKYSLKFSYQY